MLASSRSWTLAVSGFCAAAILAAIWTLPGFVTQDSPLYLYNAHLILESFRPDWSLERFFFLDCRPLPYWGAYAVLGGLLSFLPPRVADQVLMSLTSVGFAAGLMWLRWRVAGWQGGAIVAPLVLLLSISVVWTYGLHSFLLGGVLFFLTLGCWWRNREQMGAGPAVLLAVLLVAGYFFHLVSFGLTVIGIVVLAIATPSQDFRRRTTWTLVSLLPTVPLILVYARLMPGGEASVHWTGMTNFLSPSQWLAYLFMADFSAIHYPGQHASEDRFIQLLFNLPPPSRWALIGLFLFVVATYLRRSAEDRPFYRLHRGWIALAALLLVGGCFGPSDLGAAQGLLRERVLLLGIATMVPILRVSLSQGFTRAGLGLLGLAAAFQLYFYWDYAVKSDHVTTEFLTARSAVGHDKRVAAVMVGTEWPYRTNPLVHLPNMMGLDSGNLIWNNYGPALFYFPIKYRDREARLRSLSIGHDLHYSDFISEETRMAALDTYRTTMARSEASVDLLVVWSSTPELDAINREWFDPKPVFQNQRVKVLRHLSP
jgi:hypothetical protein